MPSKYSEGFRNEAVKLCAAFAPIGKINNTPQASERLKQQAHYSDGRLGGHIIPPHEPLVGIGLRGALLMPHVAQHAFKLALADAEHLQNVALGGVEDVLPLLFAGQALGDGHSAHQ